MGLFDFFKKKEQTNEAKVNQVLLAMLMFNNGETFDLDKVVNNLKNNWNIDVTDIHSDQSALTFLIDGETVGLLTIPAQIPWEEIQGAAKYSYNWQTAEQDLENHNSHVLVTIMSSKKSNLDRHIILTKVLSSVLATSNCIGVYQGSQTLLIPKDQYLESSETIKSNQIPINLWVYIGLNKGEKGNNSYTYGLKAFDKLDIEFINANFDFEELYTFICNICAYIIISDVTLKSGQTMGYTVDQKIRITKTKGQFVEGEVFKLEL